MEQDNQPTDINGYQPAKPIMSVGEEFMAWAETYWRINDMFNSSVKNPAEKGGENAPYSTVKQAFINQINLIISKRIENYL